MQVADRRSPIQVLTQRQAAWLVWLPLLNFPHGTAILINIKFHLFTVCWKKNFHKLLKQKGWGRVGLDIAWKGAVEQEIEP